MYAYFILFISFPLIYSQCNYTIKWFNENHPWNSDSNGNDIERFSLIRAKYPSIFEINRWTGFIEIRNAPFQKITNKTMLIENYTKINDGFICHAINGKQCVDYEIGFCLENNSCSAPTYLPDEKYIVGGNEVVPYSLPWHVSIQYKEKHICAGTLIDDQHILTSASCLQTSSISIPYSVVLGAHYLSNSTDRVSISQLEYHSDYNDKTSENNIGLIRLRERIQSFSDRITAACLSRSIKLPDASTPLIVAGWRTMENGTWSVRTTDELRQTVLTSMDECSRVYQKYDFEKQLCVGREDWNRDLCQGDDGSGLFEKQKYDTYRWILTGIVSYGCEHASQGYPGVYTRVSAYYNWIQNTIELMNKKNMK